MIEVLKTIWGRLLRLLGMWAMLLSVPAYGHGDHVGHTRQHNSIGRICGNPGCDMCDYLHCRAAHGVDARNYGSAPAIHHALHHPSKPKPKKLAKPRLPFEPTPVDQVRTLVGIIQPRSSDTIMDPGCGDGRLLIALCETSGARGVGLEINREIAELARAKVKAAGLEKRISIWHVDSRLVNMTGATVIVVYLFPAVLRDLDFSGARVAASYQHAIPGATRVGNWHVKRKRVF